MAEEEQLLVPVDEYLKVGLHIGTKFRTKFMSPFIYKVRPDGLAVLNVQEINKRLDLAAKMMAKYEPDDILVVCRRENGWKPVKMLSKNTSIKIFAGRYPPGILTNSKLDSFMETKLIFVADPWPDRNAINDAAKLGIPVIALCDTNNDSSNVDLVIPCNNKGKKSLALIFWILTKEYLKAKGKIKEDSEFKATIEDFTQE
ncbi:MAG: 30S ribosomal protein S2 [Nanoarchaeota archaeon]